VIIESSPFIRSLQTAAEAVKILADPENGFECSNSIKINFMLSEWQKGTFFDKCPIPDLLILNKSKEYI